MYARSRRRARGHAGSSRAHRRWLRCRDGPRCHGPSDQKHRDLTTSRKRADPVVHDALRAIARQASHLRRHGDRVVKRDRDDRMPCAESEQTPDPAIDIVAVEPQHQPSTMCRSLSWCSSTSTPSRCPRRAATSISSRAAARQFRRIFLLDRVLAIVSYRVVRPRGKDSRNSGRITTVCGLTAPRAIPMAPLPAAAVDRAPPPAHLPSPRPRAIRRAPGRAAAVLRRFAASTMANPERQRACAVLAKLDGRRVIGFSRRLHIVVYFLGFPAANRRFRYAPSVRSHCPKLNQFVFLQIRMDIH